MNRNRLWAQAGAVAVVAMGLFFHARANSQEAAVQAGHIRYTSDQQLLFPESYREWIFLSAGKGMTYGPSANPNGPPQFDNVFVNPEAYRGFVKTGRWPEKSIFVLEIREARSEGSIQKAGQFQGDVVALEVLVKDSARFTATKGWGFFEFGAKQKAAELLPKTATCYGCHQASGAVEHTFVQFYPTLTPIAAAHGTLKKR